MQMSRRRSTPRKDLEVLARESTPGAKSSRISDKVPREEGTVPKRDFSKRSQFFHIGSTLSFSGSPRVTSPSFPRPAATSLLEAQVADLRGDLMEDLLQVAARGRVEVLRRGRRA